MYFLIFSDESIYIFFQLNLSQSFSKFLAQNKELKINSFFNVINISSFVILESYLINFFKCKAFAELSLYN